MLGSLTVVLNNGQRYAADSIQCLRQGWGGDYEQSVIVIACSGVLHSWPVQDVKHIEMNTIAAPPAEKREPRPKPIPVG